MSKLTLLLTTLVAGLMALPCTPAFPQQAPSAIQILTTFDYPGTGNSTTPHFINSNGDIVGTYVDSNGVIRGFVRFSNGHFSSPLVEPDDTGNFTFSVGINASFLAATQIALGCGTASWRALVRPKS